MDGEAESKKQFLRDAMSRIITDYDHKSGAFCDLAYNSPLIVATEEWAHWSGHSSNDLRRMITRKRIDSACKTPSDADILRVFEDWRSAIVRRKVEINYRDPPLELTSEVTFFKNRKEMKRRMTFRWNALALSKVYEASLEAGDISIAGDFFNKFGQRIHASMVIKLTYGGGIRGGLSFPYYELHEPTGLDLFDLTGWRLLYQMGMPFPAHLGWTASKSKTDFSAIDTAIDILKATASYFKE